MEEFAGPVVVTVLYVFLYYGFMLNLLRVRLRLSKEYAARGEKFDRYFSQDRQMLAADRMQLNMLEHMPPFLILLWLHAYFVNVQSATIAGAIYLFSRILYPFVLGSRLGRGVRIKIMLATVPGYLVLFYFGASLLANTCNCH